MGVHVIDDDDAARNFLMFLFKAAKFSFALTTLAWLVPSTLSVSAPLPLPWGLVQSLAHPGSGIAAPASWAARVAGLPPVTTTSGRALVTVAVLSTSGLVSLPKLPATIVEFWPSVKPLRRSSLKKATTGGVCTIGNTNPSR